jgi:putative tRNA adenosine deaminase-associated protein
MPVGPSNLFAAAFVRNGRTWSGAEVDLTDVQMPDDVGDLVQDALGLTGDELTLLCVEVEDEWFALVRYDGDAEPRVFVSDVRAGAGDPLGEMFTELAGVAPDRDSSDLGVRPAGDLDLLSDFGVGADELLELSMEEGVLPADTLSVIAERLEFADELDRLR